LTLRLLLVAGAAIPLSLAVVFAADNLFNLSSSVRAGLGLVFVAGLLAGFSRLYWLYWRKPVDAAKMAVYLEQRYGISDNRLINAVHFDRDPTLPAFIKDLFADAAASSCRGMDLRRVWQHAHLKPAARLCAAGVLLFLAYAVPFAPHAKNAWLRFLNPSAALTPLNFTQFAVAPGDADLIEGQACGIQANATKSGQPVVGLDILIQDGGTPLLYPMRASGEGFAFELRDLSRDTRYAVKNGNDVSRWYTVGVTPRPRLERLTVTVTPPAYTGEKPLSLSPSKREAEVLKGSRVTIFPGAKATQRVAFFTDGKPIAPSSSTAAARGDAPASVPALEGARPREPLGRGLSNPADDLLTFDLTADTAVSLDVTDAQGLTHAGVWQCRFKMIADRRPAVRFLNRELNIEIGAGQTLPLTIEEGDDYGLTALELYTVRNQVETLIKRIDYRDIRRDRNEASVLTVSDDFFARNASYKVYARVFDNHVPAQSGTVLTPLTLHVVDLAKAQLTGDKDDPYLRLFAVLSEALEQEKALRDWVALRVETDRKERIAHAVHKRQEAVHERITLGATLAADLYRKKKIKKGLSDSVAELKSGQSEPLVRRLPAIASLNDEQRRAELNDVVLKQSEIVKALQRILGAVNADKSLEDRLQEQLAVENQDQKLFEKLQALKTDLDKFQDEQRKILADTEAIDKKDPEDWTEAEEKLLGDLAAKEQNYAKFFQAAFNDLSKVENQDFSNSTLADELVEMIEELQKAGAALEKKHIEIATVNEELIGEQAASIETNLERWLSDAKDHIKWNGEEGGLSPDVPLQDLPAELTDIMGELIDTVDDMEDVEDSSNSSLSSFDKGIGWGVSDGNMDDMSAKGITGNIMPNNNEVGGRSGEGRSGKSSGQFVEQEATGKGGRDTPTRLVQSPFEKGTVKDTSKDPQGGATGGGKQSGVGGDGLRGITPDQKPDVRQRLPGQQAELKQKAESLMRELNVRNLPTGDLEEAINKMELIQKYRSTGQGLQVKQVQSELLSSLKDARAALKTGVDGGMEKRASTSKRIATIRQPSNEATPEGYESSVDAYFRALAEPADD
jgi:hypothetical protein